MVVVIRTRKTINTAIAMIRRNGERENNMIDFHAHVLPKADHGSRNLETSIEQLKQAEAAGIHQIVATPHFYQQRHSVEEFLLRRDYCYRELEKANTTSVSLVKAAEVTITSELADLPRLEELCVGNSPFILLELPNNTGAQWVYDALYKIESNRGLKPIIAHIDRYPETVQQELLDMDLTIQVNAEAFLSFFKRKKYLDWFQSDVVHLLGSDVHGTDGGHYKAFQKACQLLKRKVPNIKQNAENILREKPKA